MEFSSFSPSPQQGDPRQVAPLGLPLLCLPTKSLEGSPWSRLGPPFELTDLLGRAVRWYPPQPDCAFPPAGVAWRPSACLPPAAVEHLLRVSRSKVLPGAIEWQCSLSASVNQLFLLALHKDQVLANPCRGWRRPPLQGNGRHPLIGWSADGAGVRPSILSTRVLGSPRPLAYRESDSGQPASRRGAAVIPSPRSSQCD
jgi:hypothetical protein